jgi:hypothetical protein
MKKTLLAITAVVSSLCLNAQDTLTEFFTGTVNFYSAQGGGYVTGNNAYGDLGKGMRFNEQVGLNGGGTISSVLLTVPAKADAGGSMTVKIHAYSVADTLGAELGSVTIPLSSIDTTEAGYGMAEGMPYNVVATFAAPVVIPNDIIVMVYLPTGAGNAIVMPSNTDEDFAFAATHTFEIWSDNTIHDFASAWQGGVNVAMPIFPVGDMVLGISENEMIQASAYPNPANDVLNIKANEAIAGVTVMTLDGKIVSTSNEAFVNVADLNAGIYMYEAVTVSGKIARGNFAKN